MESSSAVISCLQWVPKGSSREYPVRFKMTDEEYQRIQSKMVADQLENAKELLKEAQEEEDEEATTSTAAAAAGTKKGAGKKNKNKKDTTSIANSNEDDAIIKEYNLDTYDDDEDDEEIDMDDEETAMLAKDALEDAPLFGNIKGLTYHGSNSEDPYVTMDDNIDEEEELEELAITAMDNLIITAKTEDDVSHVEVYLYEGSNADNLFVHHDILLPSFPLCIEWIGYNVTGRALPSASGNESSAQPAETGSYVAVGTFDPEIEVWNLDVIDAMYPDAILGTSHSTPAARLGTGKKKKRLAKPNPNHHVDAVMCLAWNRAHPSLLASGSADTTIKLWDLRAAAEGTLSTSTSTNPTTPTTTPGVSALRSFNIHTSKVQSLSWSPSHPTALLSGGYDKLACLFDTRSPDAMAKMKLSADVEASTWDPFHPERCVIATEDGQVKCFDLRHLSCGGSTSSPLSPLWTLHAHDAAVSALAMSPVIPGLFATGSTDKTVKLWGLSSTQGQQQNLRCLVSRDLNLGKVYAAQFCPADNPETPDVKLAVAGGKGTMMVWNLEGNPAVRAFAKEVGAFEQLEKAAAASAQEGGKAAPVKEFTTVDQGEEDEDEGQVDMAGWEDDDDAEEDNDEAMQED